MGSVTSWSRARAGFESSTFHQGRLVQALDILGVGSEVLVEPADPVSGGGLRASNGGPRRASAVTLGYGRSRQITPPWYELDGRPARASVRSDGAGVGLDVGEHAAAIPAREGPYEP
jgi:hypothetical protein